VNTIDTRALPRTRLGLTQLGLGGGALGGMYDAVTEETARAAVETAYREGIRYFDAAPMYGHGRAEERLGLALSQFDRDSFVLGTKVGIVIEPQVTGPGADDHYADPWLLEGHFDFSYDACLRSLERSMARLRTDRVDIVYIHDPDEGDSALAPEDKSGARHFDDVLEGAYRALSQLRDQGVIGAIGIGNNGWEILADFARAADFDVFLLAGRYTLLEQEPLDVFLPLCEERDIRVVCGGPYNSGILATGTRAGTPYYNYVPADAATVARVGAIEDVCEQFGVSLRAAALQFPLGHPAVATVIPGAKSPAEVQDNVAAMSEEIPRAFWDALKDRSLVHPAAPVP